MPSTTMRRVRRAGACALVSAGLAASGLLAGLSPASAATTAPASASTTVSAAQVTAAGGVWVKEYRYDVQSECAAVGRFLNSRGHGTNFKCVKEGRFYRLYLYYPPPCNVAAVTQEVATLLNRPLPV